MKIHHAFTFAAALLLALPVASQGHKGGGGGSGTPPPIPDLVGSSPQYSAIRVMSRDGSNVRDVLSESYAMYPTLSPDGSQIVFAKVRNGVSAVWMVNVDGTGLHVMTDLVQLSWYSGEHAIFMRPLWSPAPPPGGQPKLLFADDTVLGGVQQLYSVNIDGSGRQQLTFEPAGIGRYGVGDICFEWSSDGSQVMYQVDDQLVIGDLADVGGTLFIAQRTVAAVLPSGGSFGAWSNDGSRAAFHMYLPGGSNHIWLLDLTQPQLLPVQLTYTSNGYEVIPTFSDDDQQVFFSLWNSTGVMNTDGTGIPTKISGKMRNATFRRH